MEILYIILTLLVVMTLLAVLKQIFSLRENLPIIGQLFHKEPEPVKPIPFRIMMAIRRREAARTRFMHAVHEEQLDMIGHAQEGLASLHKEFKNFAKYLHGFDGSETGLVSNTENEWLHFAFYDVEAYEAYRECQRVLESEKYLNLRNEFDIRLMFGDQMKSPDSRLHELF